MGEIKGQGQESQMEKVAGALTRKEVGPEM